MRTPYSWIYDYALPAGIGFALGFFAVDMYVLWQVGRGR